MGLNHSPRITTDGLVLYLDAANERSYPGSGTTWSDLSGNSNNGTLVNGVSYANQNYGAMVFDGTNDRGSFTSPVSSASPQSYEVWTNSIASTNAVNGYAYILHNNGSDSTTGNSYMNIGVRPTQQYFAAFNGTHTSMEVGVTASLSSIVQIVLTWDTEVQMAYVNGELKNSQALSSIPQNFSSTTSFGDYSSSTYRMIQGNIYKVQVYNRALSSIEIQQNFNATRSRFGI